MRSLTTFMAAIAVCTVLLFCTAYWIDAPPSVAPSTGLTAATVLGTDGMVPVDGPSASGRGTVASEGPVDSVPSGVQG